VHLALDVIFYFVHWHLSFVVCALEALDVVGIVVGCGCINWQWPWILVVCSALVICVVRRLIVIGVICGIGLGCSNWKTFDICFVDSRVIGSLFKL